MDEVFHKKVMIIEDDVATRRLLELACGGRGYQAISCASGKEALAHVSDSVSAIILDLGLPDIEGLGLLQELLKAMPWVPCFILTATDSAQAAVASLKIGAKDYFTKPVDMSRLFDGIHEAVRDISPSLRSSTRIATSVADQQPWQSAAGSECHRLALNAAASGMPLLLSGESGTGRMTMAKLVHAAGARHQGPLKILNASNPEKSCDETELFGHAGAGDGVPLRGLLYKARGGTLVIQDIEKLPLSLQSRIARSLASGRYQQNGSITFFQMECQVICITSANLEDETASRRFSKKLWLILRNMHIPMPALRSRIEDLPRYCSAFLMELCVANKSRRPVVTSSAMNVLLQHHWPDNLDELKHCVEIAFKSCNGQMIAPSDLPRYLWDSALQVSGSTPPVVGTSKIFEIERASLLAALKLCGGNRRLAAQRLGVSLRTVYNMIKRYQMD